MEESEIFRRVIEERQTRKWRILKIVTQILAILVMIAIFSLFITALIINQGEVENIYARLIVCVIVTEAVCAVGLFLITLWTQIR